MDQRNHSEPSAHNARTLAKFPSEIVCQIFEYACESIGDVNDTGTMRFTTSQVCKEWRYIALAHTRMWAKFSYTATPQDSLRPPVDRLELHLNRSGIQPLDIFLDLSRDEVDPKGATKIIKTITPHIHRWQTIDIYTNHRTPTNDIFKPLVGASAPKLKALTFYRDWPLTSFPTITPQILLGGAPRLAFLHMDSYGPWAFLPPLSNITSLILDGLYCHNITLPWSFLLHLLQLPLLSSVCLCHVHVEHQKNDPPQTNPLTMPNLTHLQVSNSPTITSLLPSLDAPKLRSLEHYDFIPRTIMYLRVGLDPLPSTHTRPKFLSLTTLLFELLPTSNDAPLLHHLFHQASHLKHLIILDPGPRAVDFASVRISQWRSMIGLEAAVPAAPNTREEPPIWPALERVTLNLRSTTPIDEVLKLVEFLLACPSPHHVRKVRPRLTLELDPRLVDGWKRPAEPESSLKFALLQRHCDVVGWDFGEVVRVRERAGWWGAEGGPRLMNKRTASLLEFRSLYL